MGKKKKTKTTKAELRAQIREYEHALDHIIDCSACIQCNQLAVGALAGVSRADFMEVWGE